MGMKLRVVVLVCLAAVVLVIPPAAQPDEGNAYRCHGAATGTYDNIVVPAGPQCILTGATVTGNVTVLENGRLYATNNGIHGNVEGVRSQEVWLDSNRVGGDVWVSEGGPSGLPIWFCNNTVTGDLQVEKTVATTGGAIIIGFGAGCTIGNTVGANLVVSKNVMAPTLSGMNITINTVGENLQVFDNTGAGPKHVESNTVSDTIQCFNNQAPFSGGPNPAATRAEGQCFRFVPGN
jgi:hypothetical protein